MSKKSNKVRADGRIAVQVFIGTVDGKRKYKTAYGKSQKEAEAAADEIRAKLKKGINLTDSNDTFAFWAEAWLNHKEIDSTPGYVSLCRARTKYWTDEIGSYQISKINIRDIESVFQNIAKKNPRTGKQTSKKTLTEVKNIVNSIFSYAVQNRVIDFNPAQFLSVPKNAPKNERRALTDEEINWIINTPDVIQTACMIMLFAGLRRGEVGVLTWNDIDFKNNTITVNKAADLKSPGEAKAKSPKTRSGFRTIPLCDVLKAYLQEVPHDNILICSKDGKMLTEGDWAYRWRNYIKKLNDKYGDFQNVFIPPTGDKPLVIKNFSAHCLRHTFCSMLNEAGVNIVEAKEIMGHSDIHTTLQIYTHVRKENPDLPRNQLNDFLSKNESASQSASQK